MTNEEREFGAVVDRLRAFGSQPVDVAVSRAHLAAVAAVTPHVPWLVRVRRSRSNQVRLAGAVLAASVLGGSGLAFAGSLPAGMQNAAHDAFHVVGINVPSGDSRSGDAGSGNGGERSTPTSSSLKGSTSSTSSSALAPGGPPAGSGVFGTSTTTNLAIQGPSCVAG